MTVFWIGHQMLGDVLGFCAAAHLYSVKTGQPVHIHFQPERKAACEFFDGIVWVEKQDGMVDCGRDPSLTEWPTMNGVKRFYRWMDPTLTPGKSFDIHFNRQRPDHSGRLIGLITHSNTQGDIDPVVLDMMLLRARRMYPNHRIVLIGNMDNRVVPEGVEDLRQPHGDISWIINTVGTLDLLISPQSGPCFAAAGWGVPMWIYRSREDFWDYTLNYETYKVARWFDRPIVYVETPANYLELCQQANRRFYQQVLKLIDTKVVIVHRRDFTNLGDFASNPALYFDLPVAGVIDIAEDKAIERFMAMGFWFIIGGGGLISPNGGGNRLQNIERIIKGGKAIIWGAGKNSFSIDRVPHKYPSFLSKASLVGLRDRDQTVHQWVPCASCMSEEFSKERRPYKEIVIYSHADNRIDEISKTNRSFNKLSECLDYIGIAKTIVTSSYHGAYWGKLMNRVVALKKAFNSKFHGL